MAKMYVTEYVRQAADSRGQSIAAGEEPSVAVQVIDFTAGEAKTAVNLNPKTTFIRLHTDAICSFSVGGTATTNMSRMAANQTEFMAVIPETVKAGVKVSAITNT